MVTVTASSPAWSPGDHPDLSSPPSSVPTSSSTHSSSTTATDGPLRSLADKAASTNLVRRARDTVPSFVEPAVTRTERVSGKVISRVDASLVAAQRTLDTEEGKQLVTSAQAFWTSLLVFGRMLGGQGLTMTEHSLGVESQDDAAGIERVRAVVGVATNKVKERLQRREKEAGSGVEAEVYAKGRVLLGVIVAVMACVAVALSKYRGPAKEWVVPAAEKALAVLPTDGEREEDTRPGGERAAEELPIETRKGASVDARVPHEDVKSLEGMSGE